MKEVYSNNIAGDEKTLQLQCVIRIYIESQEIRDCEMGD